MWNLVASYWLTEYYMGSACMSDPNKTTQKSYHSHLGEVQETVLSKVWRALLNE